MQSTKKILDDLVADLQACCADSLIGVLLHGAEAHGEHYEGTDALFLLIVLKDLELKTLAALRPPLSRWLKRGHPMPRFFTPEAIARCTDVFPMELLDVAKHHVVLHGTSPFGEINVDNQHLRLQCEREMREKLMRVQEAYVESKGRPAELKRLIAESYLAFVNVFRGVLRLTEKDVPVSSRDCTLRFCERNGMAPEPFQVADDIAHGRDHAVSIDEAFANYYSQLVKATNATDALGDEK